MQLGEFKITFPDGLEESPGPTDGHAIVLQPEPEPLPNANTIEGMIAGYGLVASAGARKGGGARIFTLFLLAGFVLPAIATVVSYFVLAFR